MDEQQTTLEGFTETAVADKKVRKPKAASAPRPSAADEAQIISYHHLDRRKNNPEVGVVNTSTDPDSPRTVWDFDPHLDPALQFDSGRLSIETLIDDALASGDEAEMRAALEELKRLQSPYLNWTGKAERTSFSVDTVSLHVHERMDPMSILAAVRKHMKESKAGKMLQPGLFEAPFESLPLRDAIDFYKHDRGWANRLVAGGKGEGWQKIKKNIRAELNEELLEQFHGTVSLPFEPGDNRKVAVKIVDDRGIESLKIIPLED